VDGDTVKARQVALQIALQKAVEKYGVSRIFTFHGSVKAARSFTADDGEGIVQHLPDFTTLHVSGEMPTARREDQMKAFRQAGKAVMSNARCLTEGVDVPAVDMVAFISPRKSKVDIVQATGRAMRKSPGKEFGYVMVPLFVEQAANESIEDALKRTGFDDVWDLLGAMKEQDDVLVDIIRQMQEDKGRTGGYNDSRFRDRVEVLGTSVSLETIREAITAECLETFANFWDRMYGELLSFNDTHGHTNVPKRDATSLDMWVSQQRHYYKTGKLLPQRREKLEQIGFEWSRNESAWDNKYFELIEFKEKQGHLNPARDIYPSLYSWILRQRAVKQEGRLEVEKEKKLDLIGFDWDPTDSSWNGYFDVLMAYKSQHGHSNVPSSTSGVGVWAANQRSKYRKGTLSADKINRLSETGFDFNPMDSLWETRLGQLIAYKEEFSSLEVPQRHPSGLGQWLSLQRKRKKSGELSDELAKKLESIGFQWHARDAEWERRFDQLLEYVKKYGTANVPQKEETGLGQWVSVQRRSKKKGTLSVERESRLKQTGFKW
ncbi:MAG TPA: Helicase associated domain protein, partial [Rugosibacter sp.]|nr:Helicase associated domain protein [Rugosibacter sp.]